MNLIEKSPTFFKPNDSKALLSFVFLSSFSGLSIYLSTLNWLGILIGNILMTALMWSWFSILHSTGHNTYFKTSIFNLVAGHVASFFVFVPFYPWKYSHQSHHQWTGYKNLDPSQNEIPETPPDQKTLARLEILWKIGFPVISIWHFLNSLVKSQKKQYPQKEAFSQIVLLTFHLTFLYFDFSLWLKVFSIPYFFFLLLSDVVLTSQHLGFETVYGNPDSARPMKLSSQENVSRSFKTHVFIDRFVFLNFNLHSAHHQYPTVPHYDLHLLSFKPTHQVSLWTWWKTIKKKSLKEIYWGSLDQNNLATKIENHHGRA